MGIKYSEDKEFKLDFQKFVDGFAPMTCIMSVEKLPDGKYGEIRIVAGNKAYVDSIENMPDAPKALSNKFIPNSIYTNYFPHDLNFEFFLYNSAVLKKPMHSYVHPERFDFWFNLFCLPIDADDGNICYCTYTQELTHDPDSTQMATVSHDVASEVLSTCIKMRGATDFKTAMDDVIKDIRELCGAAYCCILNMNELSKTCAVVSEDMNEETKQYYKANWCDENFFTIAESWSDVIGGSNCLILKDEHDMLLLKEKNPVWYDSMKEANIYNIVLFPLRSGFELLGYIWANNFDIEKANHIKETLELTTFFIASEMSSYQMFDKFRILSTVDLLTGVLNRNEMNNRVMQLSADDRPGRKNIGIVFADLNGLKQMNDNEGHSAGDKLIKTAAEILKSVFPANEIYRAGGDEFMVLLRDTDMDTLKSYEKEIKEKASQTDYVSFAVGLSIKDDSQKIYEAMKIADVNMYEDKKRFYEAHPERKRR